MKRLIIFFMLLLTCTAAGAEEMTFVYTKTVLKIIPRVEIVATEPVVPDDSKKSAKTDDDASTKTPDNLMPKLKRTPKEFTVELREPSFLDQKDFIAHQPFDDKEGLMILITPPRQAQLSSTHMIASADVLFVDADGIIVKIAPQVDLFKLAERIDSDKPIRAFVYLKAGAVADNDIRIGDRLENTYFKTHPVVIE
jgi:uncharacterized membrane protein (UPF0127 family)